MFINKIQSKEEDFKIVHMEIQSRHVNRTKYKVFIRYLPHSDDLNNISWICNCKSGKRTIGCCSHIAAFIYYLANGRYQVEIPKPGVMLNSFLVEFNRDSDESENEEENLTSSIRRSLSIESNLISNNK